MKKIFFILVLVTIVCIVFAQDNKLNRDIRPNMSLQKAQPYTIDFFNGLSFPQGNLNTFLKDGFNSGVLIHKRFGKKLSVGLSANYSQYNHKQSTGLNPNPQRHELSTTSFDIGPQYNLNLGRFTLEFYGRSGLSIVNSPQSFMMYPETDIMITSLEAYKSTALTTRLGANMTAKIVQGLKLYFSSEYITSLNNDMNYQTRDLSEAFREDGTLDFDAANKLPLQNESLSLSMFNVNFGVRISFGKSRKQKPNSLYQKGGISDMSPVYETKSVQSRDWLESDIQRKNNKLALNVQDTNKPTRTYHSSVIAPEPDMSKKLVDAKANPIDEDSFVSIPREKLKLKSKAQIAKERRKMKRKERRAKRTANLKGLQ
ncbi:hypothetical protein EO244_12955 [Ancylomarina salipaludis]|uniref:Uncharacterized protein n=1 Tax=Ancylomarina salipaludis TaxID=2501299 RepID=A0A4Q1JKJ4_9BACT|nr:outer membrane beta-barrel protein [Ancylomarina salipaludis]RXQ91007.1 hypothetical protein EO244_12955 [Ancylomarina salipaludis]